MSVAQRVPVAAGAKAIDMVQLDSAERLDWQVFAVSMNSPGSTPPMEIPSNSTAVL